MGSDFQTANTKSLESHSRRVSGRSYPPKGFFLRRHPNVRRHSFIANEYNHPLPLQAIFMYPDFRIHGSELGDSSDISASRHPLHKAYDTGGEISHAGAGAAGPGCRARPALR